MQVVDANGNMFGYDSITVAGQDGKPKTLSSAIKLVSLVRNQTGSTLTKGTVVYINGGSGNKPTVTKALATSDATSAQTYGVVQSNIGNNKNGYVVVAGALDGLNTSAYAPGTQLYLSSTTAGAWTSTKQLAPAHLVYVGIVVRQHVNQGVVEVKIQNGYELDEIHDVQIISPTNGQTLVYDSVTSLWKNASGGGGGGVTNITVNPPLATTGGSTPDLSITEADGSTDGYLTTADWTTFNNKQDAITLTTTGTSGAATLVGSTLNIPQYSGGGSITPPQVDLFTSSGVWTKPAGAVYHEIYVVSGAGGGGSGRRGAASTFRGGGGGAASGTLAAVKINSSALSSTENVWIGAGGAGGAAITVNDTNGNNGVAGNPTYFGGIGTSATSKISTAGGSAGTGGATANGGTANITSTLFGVALTANTLTAGTVASTTAPTTSNFLFRWLCAGAGGGGIAANNTTSGGAGMRIVGGDFAQIIYNQPSTSGTGNNGSNGTFYTDTVFSPFCALGGSGGSAGDTAGTIAAGRGGNGAIGAGGAGGGASTNGANSGAGGNGGNGFVMIITYFQ